MNFNKEELEIISHALTLRESRMLKDAELYRDDGNHDAQRDCMDEWRKTSKLNDSIREYLRKA